MLVHTVIMRRYVNKMFNTIVTEMAKGNFSFLILIVGIIQVILMWRNNRDNKS